MGFSLKMFSLSPDVLFWTVTFLIGLNRVIVADDVIIDMAINDDSVGTDEQIDINKERDVPSSFLFSQCGENPKLNPIQIKKFSIKPDPLVLPGTMKVKLSMKVKEEIEGPIKESIKLEIHTKDGWHSVPCSEEGYGSCEYPDVCPLLNSVIGPACPKDIKDKGQNCNCPLQPGKYHFKTIKLPMAAAFDGPFNMLARFTSEDGRLLACLNTTIIFQKGADLNVGQCHGPP